MSPTMTKVWWEPFVWVSSVTRGRGANSRRLRVNTFAGRRVPGRRGGEEWGGATQALGGGGVQRQRRSQKDGTVVKKKACSETQRSAVAGQRGERIRRALRG